MSHETKELENNIFVCLTCGRKVEITSFDPPVREVLEEGDPLAVHSWGRGVTVSVDASEDNLFSDFVNRIDELGGAE